jgi:Flp pilus assembly protein TadG
VTGRQMRRQAGATAVEFALVLTAFLTLVLGILDFSRMLYTWNAATEATRWGARTAVVCDRNDAAVLRNMRAILPQLTADNLQVTWFDAAGAVSNSCTFANCGGVEVSVQNLDYAWISPIGFSSTRLFRMPSFSTYLSREIMGQDPNSTDICD